MPSTSEKQRKYFGMELAKKRAGQPTDVKMSEQQLRDFAKGPVKPKKHKKTSRGK